MHVRVYVCTRNYPFYLCGGKSRSKGCLLGLRLGLESLAFRLRARPGSLFAEHLSIGVGLGAEEPGDHTTGGGQEEASC